MYESEETLDKLERTCIREVCKFKGQRELSLIREDIEHSDNSTFTPIRP